MRQVEYKFPIEVLVGNIFKLFHILHESGTVKSAKESLQMVLFFISLYKDGLITNLSSYDPDAINQFQGLIDKLADGKLNNYDYQQVAQILRTELSRLSKTSYSRIASVLNDLDFVVLKENFPVVFDDIVYRFSRSEGRYAGEFIQPVELTRLMCGLSEVKQGAKVYNPFAGLASFGVYLDNGHNYFGQELNQKTWALGTLRLMAYKKSDEFKYVCNDSIAQWPDGSEKFDLIISNTPIGLKLGSQYNNIVPKVNSIEEFLFGRCVQSLSNEGKLIALVSEGFLYKNGIQEQHLKKNLIENDLIDTIISLPSGLMLNTGIAMTIVLLNKDKRMPGKVKFIDGKRFLVEKGARERILDDKALLHFIHSNEIDETVIRTIDNEEILENDCNLNIRRYFQKQIEGIRLGEILESVRGQRGNLPETGKLIRIRDLKEDKVDFTLDVSNVEKIELKRPDIHLVSESCLLLAMRWRTLKPTLFEFKGEPIFRSQDILSFKVNESIADKAYLINELHSDYVKEQLESYRFEASVMPFIRRDDLMEIVIKLPSIEEQRAKVQGIYELSDKIKSLQEERNALAHGKTLKQFSEFASLKHTLGRPRQNILDWSDNLLDFLTKKKEDFEALNKAFTEFYDIDIISVLKEIKRDINFITDVLEKGENGLVLSKYEKQVIPLSDINSIINELSNNGFNFKIRKLLVKGEKLNEKGIYANKTLFKTLLDNILTNANKYGFDKKASGNEVVIELTEIDDFLSLEIKNNGRSFPRNIDREKFITKYSTANSDIGSGLGGYDIHRIASDFGNAEWILSLDEDPLYPVILKFQFLTRLLN